MRKDRLADELRPITIDTTFSSYAEGSALISIGDTCLLCTVSIEERQPGFRRNSQTGWITAEFSMLPRATHTRGGREAVRGKQNGRTIEIQRLIGRSLRAVLDLKALGPRTITLDCDVLQANGSTRAAAITGAWVALRLALNKLLDKGTLSIDPMIGQVAAVSCGFVNGEPLLDMDYSEDSQAAMDANFIMTKDGSVVEIQATAEDVPLPWEKFMELKKLADKGIAELVKIQLAAIED
ncbi:MAG: ribonuclease PH [Mariprofundus sp.]|nr:ribonuclease PH [Mariprofundus sp.]